MITRNITEEQDKILHVIDSLRYATLESITITDGKIRRMKIVLNLDMDNPESFKKSLEELRTIQL